MELEKIPDADMALLLAHSLCQRMQRYESKPFWYRLSLDERGYGQASATDWNYYWGHGGIFLSLLPFRADPFISTILEELLRDFVDDDPGHVGDEGDWSIGGMLGVGSYLLVASRAVDAFPRAIGDVQQLCTRIVDSIPQQAVLADPKFDIMEGAAGLMLAVVAGVNSGVIDRNSSAAISLIDSCASHLINGIQVSGTNRAGWLQEDSGEPLGGLSHGYAGVALAAQRALRSSIGNPSTLRELYAFSSEQQVKLWDIATHHFEDLRPPDPAIDSMTEAWCHGGEGILLAILDDPGHWGLDDETVSSVALGVLEGRQAPQIGLCHGFAGRLTILRRMLFAPEGLSQEVHRMIPGKIEEARNGLRNLLSRRWATELEDTSLMTGIGGAILALGAPREAWRAMSGV